MKRIHKFIISVFAFAAVLPSCSDLLEPEPYGLVDPELVWTKYNYTSSLVSNIGDYSEWNSAFTYAAYSDEGHHVQDRTSGSSYYNWYTTDFLANSFPLSSNYGGFYNNIYTINYFLTNCHKISFTNITENELNFWYAKAHVYRAWHYFMLMKRFGQAVIITEPYSITEDFKGVKLNTVEEIADFIIEELDTALATPEDESDPLAFRWRLNSGQYGKINRGFAWVLKARTALYAASPLYYKEGSKYTWEYAYQINKEAVEQLATHDHSLFNIAPSTNPSEKEAYCCYDYYHVYPNGDAVVTRSIDKETILANNATIDMWRGNGLPTTKGMLSAGCCPTQELVDAYETIDGEPILDLEQPYLDEAHLQPNYNKNNKLYDPENPYENRDPRFYGTVYYNGAPRWWGNPDSLRVETFVGGNCEISEEANSLYNTRTGYYLRKFNRDISDEDGNYDGRVHMARLAEMYLNLAECACESGNLDVAAEYTNLVRERSGMPALPEGLSQNQLRLRIRNERRVELAFENFRFDDVRRWKIIDQTEEHITGMKITKDASTGKLTYQRISLVTRVNKGADKYLLYPMNEEEVRKMKSLTGDDWQTPGW